jgi:hypothetical protein
MRAARRLDDGTTPPNQRTARLDRVTTLGDFELVDRLDRRSATPWFAARRHGGRALIRLVEARAGSRERVRDAIRAAALPPHASHLTLLDAAESDGRPYLIYEPAFGPPLDEIDLGPIGLPAPVAAAAVVALMDGVRYLHRHGRTLGGRDASEIIASFDGRFLWADPMRPESSRAVGSLDPDAAGPDPARDWYRLGRIAVRIGPVPEPSDGSSTADWFAAVAPLVERNPEDRDPDRAERRLRAIADPEAAERWVRDRHRPRAARLAEALRRPPPLPVDRPATPETAQGGSGPVAGEPSAIHAGPHRLGRRHPSPSPLALHTAWGPLGPTWVRRAPSEGASDDAARAYEREAHHARAVSSPGLAELLEASEHGLVYRRSRGRTLVEWLRASAGRSDDASAVLRGVLELLIPLHARGLVAGTLVPSALHVADDGAVELIDRSSLGPAGTLAPWRRLDPMGLGPECFRDGRYELASERFALGTLIFEILAGGRPFHGLDADELARATERGPRVSVRGLNPEVPSRLARVVDALVDPDPAARPALSDVLDALSAR